LITKDWDSFCIVGIGRHAKERIIPALKNNGKNILGYVSSKKDDFLPSYNNLLLSYKSISKDVVYIVCSPPRNHFEQAISILKSGRSVIVEKPAFMNRKEAVTVLDLCKKDNLIFVEAFMYQHTKIFNKFIALWNENKNYIKNININFLIPEFPLSTFRDNSLILETVLFDIGCYPISLLVDIGFSEDNLFISNSSFNSNLMKLNIVSIERNININISIGISPVYQNYVELETFDNKNIIFSKFFHGLSINKAIKYQDGGNSYIDNFIDENGFENMFNIPSKNWIENQNIRFSKIIKSTTLLESINRELSV